MNIFWNKLLKEFLIDFWSHFGSQDGGRINKKHVGKMIKKMMTTKMAKKSHPGIYEGARPDDFGAWG
jgi:hypothetical protein